MMIAAKTGETKNDMKNHDQNDRPLRTAASAINLQTTP